MSIHPKDMEAIEYEHTGLMEQLNRDQAALNDRMMNFQNHAYLTGLERGKAMNAATAPPALVEAARVVKHQLFGNQMIEQLIKLEEGESLYRIAAPTDPKAAQLLQEKLDESHRQEARLEERIKELESRKFVRFNSDECWAWQGDGSDNLESLVCPVVIRSADLLEIIRQRDEAMHLASEAQQQTATQLNDQADKITVTRSALKEVLTCLISSPHLIRELQATRVPVGLFPDNPINKLIAEFESSMRPEAN